MRMVVQKRDYSTKNLVYSRYEYMAKSRNNSISVFLTLSCKKRSHSLFPSFSSHIVTTTIIASIKFHKGNKMGKQKLGWRINNKGPTVRYTLSSNGRIQRKNLFNVLYIIKLIIIQMSSKLYINMLPHESRTNFSIKPENLENIQDI